MEFFIELQKKFLINNINNIKKISQVQIAPVLKANAYGHGIKEIIQILREDKDIKRICLLSYSESQEARKHGWKKNIIILDPTIDIKYNSKYEYIIKSFEFLHSIIQYAKINNKIIKAHIKCNCGLNRMGFNIEEIPFLIDILKKNIKYIKVVGITTHLPRINYEITNEIKLQLDLFQKITTSIKTELHLKNNIMIHPFGSRGFNLIQKHNIPCNMIRSGGLIYGLIENEYQEIIKQKNSEIKFQQIMTLKAQISHIRTIEKGDFIGYGNNYQTNKNMKIAIVNFGYGYGYSSKMVQCPYGGYFDGNYFPFVGIIAMNHIFLEIPSHIEKINIGNYITLTSNEYLPIIQISSLLKNREYVFTASLNSNIPKIII